MQGLHKLKDYLRNYLLKKTPGYISFLNIYCMSKYRTDCISLIPTSPSKVYLIMLAQYKGDILSADYAFIILFINPIVELLRKPDLVEELLHLAKTGRDKEFLELIEKHLSCRDSAA